MTAPQLPQDADRVVREIRRRQPPEGLLDSVMSEVQATSQARPFRVSWPQLASIGAAAALIGIAAFGLSRMTNVGRSPAPGPPTGLPTHAEAPAIEDLAIGGSIAARIPVPDGAHPASADDESVWLGSETTGEVLRIDPGTAEPVGRIQVNEPTSDPYNLSPVSDGHSVWAAGRDDRSLVRIDIRSMSVVDRWPIKAIPYAIAPAGSSVWLTDFEGGRVLKVDARNGRLQATTDLPDATGIAATPSAVWATTYFGRLVRIDPATASITATFSIDVHATALQSFGDDLLITGINGRRLERWNVADSEVAAWSEDVWAVGFVKGQLWATVPGGVVRLDPVTLQRMAAVPMPGAETDQLVVAAGRLWAYGGTVSETSLYVISVDD